MSVTLEDILDKMKTGSAESDFVQKLAEQATPVQTVTDPAPIETDPAKTAAPVVTDPVVTDPVVTPDPVDEVKLAETLDEEGRVFARAFYDELNKIATEKVALNPPTGMTPNRGPFQQMNPAIQNSLQEDPRGPEVDRVVQILNSLVGNPTMPATKTEVGPLASPAAAAPTPVMGQQVTNAEVEASKEEAMAYKAEAAHKTGEAVDPVTSALYTHYFDKEGGQS